MFEPWPFQNDIIKETQQGFRRYKRQCIVAPTGSGKTVISGTISLRVYNELLDKSKSIALYLVHRRELIDQTVNTLVDMGLAYGQEIGIIAAGHPITPWAPMQVASVQTIVRRLDQLPWLKPKLVWYDEAHHVAAMTWAKIYDHFKDAYILGLSATPERLDGKGLKPYFDNMVIGPQISDLVPDYLAPSMTYSIPPKVDLKGLSLKKAGELMSGPVIADAVQNWQRLASDRQTIFFCINTEHSRNTVAKLVELGYRAEHLDFKTPEQRRKNVLNGFRKGDIQCLSNVELFTEGMDAKNCNCVVIARRTNSFTFWRQANGRHMRVKPDGGSSITIDCGGNVHGCGHGPADADVDWSLEYGFDTDQKKKIAATHRTCDACGYEYQVKLTECPVCGAKPASKPIQEVEVDVELVKGKANKAAKPNKKTLTAKILATEGDIAKLDEIRKQYGYHWKWTARMKKLYDSNVFG